MSMDCCVLSQPYARSKRLKRSETAVIVQSLYARQASPESAMLQIFTLEGAQHFRMTAATLTRQQCLDLASTLTEVAQKIK